MTTQSVIGSLSEVLVRDAKVVVGDTHKEHAGETMVVASKGTVPCNGKGKCAGDNCVGLAVFVTDQDYAANPDPTKGWRHNTAKICLTHLQDEDGNPLIPEGTSVKKATKAKASKKTKKKVKKQTATATGRRGRPRKSAEPIVEEIREEEKIVPPPAQVQPVAVKDTNGPNVVTWEMLSNAATAGDYKSMTIYARRLKAENEILIRQMLNLMMAQQR
jgi:hypothetical protein